MCQQYVTGGAVRDVLMRREPKDIDFVWTGITSEFLTNKGYNQVGVGFPVFLDQQGQEHALARMERKTGVGYTGFECIFDPSVTIEQDLERRDLTMNSMAVRIEDWEEFKQTKNESLVIDPFEGIKAINHKVLIHTSEAFCEDPVRILRTSRFSARYNFSVFKDTMRLMCRIVPELDYVPPERVWAEIEKGLMEKHPKNMFNVLYLCEAFNNKFLNPYKWGIGANFDGIPSSFTLEQRFAMVSCGFNEYDFHPLKIPNSCAQIAMDRKMFQQDLAAYEHQSPERKLEIFMYMRVFNDTQRITKLIEVLQYTMPYMSPKSVEMIWNDIDVVSCMVDTAAIASQYKDGQQIKQAIYEARLAMLS